ncbi:MAG: UDP-N-acetylglucosamine--N-acetylmuramyl-(pentapeptide) pyrophosphoryl-undecaprenol N-acetylglucosamine transferase [Anaerolineae bacterium]|nr:UDP-N-acetylglucosamine--N-acetylmuramyl-(pentapeptide) pyrophosphoryl-undecaprenol N-acetylglucosamine transferase [Anaerolineales bacterium]MCW5846729.1 UDP-N-acetylglucosamine--N-acetylmuramyl-(pentapeptide) pyrophosphoryl-undecaprenol N-acetylglucosamine transferase [Anaerolineae bacterium]
MMRVLVCAGGTGGGIYPALAAVKALQAHGIVDENVLWLGTKGEMEETLVTRAGLRLETISGGPIVGVPWSMRARNALKLARGIGAASDHVRRFRPNVMLMTGGYVAVPVAVAARRHQIPIVIYLPDVEPGSSIRFAVPLARRIACTTDGSRAYVPAEKVVVTGYPVRPDIRAARQLTKEQALARFDLVPGRPTLFVFGGSRGARTINRALMAVLPQLLADIQVIHVSGTLTWPEVEANAATLPAGLRAYYRPYPYLHDDMGPAFRAADLVLARAGASMLGECPAFGLPSILVPLTFAWRYQKVNADYLTAHGAAVQLTDETLADSLQPTVRKLLFDSKKLALMSTAAATLDKPDAATELARVILAEATPDDKAASPLAQEETSC